MRTLIVSVQVSRLFAAVAAWWFGHMRYWTPFIHRDDHRNLASQAIRYLVREGHVESGSPLEERRRLIEDSCGRLDLVAGESLEMDGSLEWDYAHLYDPVARRGVDEDTFVNAFDEFGHLWERALAACSAGDRPGAFRFLGYCCHLLQDMAVPAHTHCVLHGLASRKADNLELVSCSRRFYLRPPPGSPRPGDRDAHLELFLAMGTESRGRVPGDPRRRNEIADVLERYYTEPGLEESGWHGSYVGESYFPYHRLLPSSPRIRFADVIVLRNFLMCRAAERTAQLIQHFAAVTSSGKADKP